MQTNFSSVIKSLSLTELDNLQSYKQIGQQLKKIQASSVAVSDTRIVVGTNNEAYIFDIDGNEIKKIQASDAEEGDQFGYSVAVSDTRIVVGAPYEDTTDTDAGSAYIFDINGNQLAKIQAFGPPGTNDAEADDQFGRSVAVSNTRIVVGAPYEDTTASGAGSAYIFDIDGNEIKKIQASDAEEGDQFGYSVAVSDTRIVVGAPYEDTVNIYGPDEGSAYIFDIDGNQIAKIQASDAGATTTRPFGWSVAVSDTRIVVGAHFANIIFGYAYVGKAYIFDINGNQIAKLQASDAQPSDFFGRSVAVSNTRIVVGAPGENLNQTDASAQNGRDAGAVYIFDINGNQIAKRHASDAQTNDQLGYSSVAVSNTRIVINNIAGAAYIFSPGFSPFGDLCAYYDLGDPTVLDTNFSWSNYT